MSVNLRVSVSVRVSLRQRRRSDGSDSALTDARADGICRVLHRSAHGDIEAPGTWKSRGMRIRQRRQPLPRRARATALGSALACTLAFGLVLSPSTTRAPSASAREAGGASTSGARLWYPPLGPPLRISSAYALPNGPYRAGHRGIDLPAAPGDAVRSPAAGIVSFVGTVADRAVLSIRIDPRTVVSLEPVTSELREGEAVAHGEAIGAVDAGGHCAATCLHLGVRIDDAYVNPLRFLRQKPVLLPW